MAAAIALRLAIPPGYASPLFPAAGIALACVLMYGPRMLPGIALGSLLSATVLSVQGMPKSLEAWALPVTFAVGATLQAWLGAWLVRRRVQQPLTLSEPADIARFLACAVASCLVSASLATLALWLRGRAVLGALPFNWGTWFVGDLLGVLIATPIALSLYARPREAWAPRRLSVGAHASRRSRVAEGPRRR